ncbi:hypothetical protein ACH5RR_026929 [Cinchona calisaya]|uniref:Uncharacterized protein n=1 Tax=Cinchona calisaya TaxID=153742 RepID=A0ABD2Z404_9GENT
MEFRRPRHHQQIGRRSTQNHKPNGMCKKHPKHQQSPGVCSICLREKLTQLSSSTSSSRNNNNNDSSCSSSSSLSSMSSSHYSASASSCSSPLRRRDYRIASVGRGLSLSFIKSGKNVLTKSRSVAFIARKRDGGHEEVGMDHGKKKGSFWSKLLWPRRKRNDEDLVHSRSITRVH